MVRRALIGLASLLLAAAAACSSFGTNNTPVSNDGGTDGASDGGSDDASNGTIVDRIGRIFAVGGRTTPYDADGGYPFSSEVWIADVDKDGNLGSWRAGPTLPQPFANHAAVATPSALLTFGGEAPSANTPLKTVYSARFDEQGLAPFATTNELPAQLQFSAAVVAGSKVHVIGGDPVGGTDSSGIVFTAELDGENVKPWAQTTFFSSEARRKHGSVVSNNAIYTVGGEAPDNATAPCRQDVLKMPLDGNGFVTSAENTGSTISRYHAAVTVRGEYIYVLGGWICAASVTNQATIIRIDKGQTAAPAPMAPLPSDRYAFGAAVVGDFLYAVGGDVSGKGPTNEVLVGRIGAADGKIASWSTARALPKPIAYHTVTGVSR
jgi:hypothetical protein